MLLPVSSRSLLTLLTVIPLASSQDVRLVGGFECEGLVELRAGGGDKFAQACNLHARHQEAQVVCRQLGCEPEGAERVDPIQYGFTSRVDAYVPFGYSCDGEESRLDQCLRSAAHVRHDNPDYAVAVHCGPKQTSTYTPVPGEVGVRDIRLVGGTKCEGRVEIKQDKPDSEFGQAVNLNAGNNEAMVVCRQLSCNTKGARRVGPTQYGFSSKVDHYVAFGFACNGGEHNLNDCPEPGAVAKYDHPDYAVAVRCGPGKYDASIDPKRDTPPQPHTSRPGTELRLVGGSDKCEGRLEAKGRSGYLQACSRDAGLNEAAVVCRHVGCSPEAARRMNAKMYGLPSTDEDMALFNFLCSGDESNVDQCQRLGATCGTSDNDRVQKTADALAFRCTEPVASSSPVFDSAGTLVMILFTAIALAGGTGAYCKLRRHNDAKEAHQPFNKNSEPSLTPTPTPAEVNKYIKDLDVPSLYELGGQLGLNTVKLRKIPSLELALRMSERWIREDDGVSNIGTPSWEELVKALRSVGANGVANKVESEKIKH